MFAEDGCPFLCECVRFTCFLIALPPTLAMCQCQKVNLIVPGDPDARVHFPSQVVRAKETPEKTINGM